jgi:hypothetical protein
MRAVCLVALASLWGCNGPSSVADLKQPAVTLAIRPQPTSCLEYIGVDGDNVIWTQTGCDPDVFLDRQGWITAGDRTTLDARFENARADEHPGCGGIAPPTAYHAERLSPTIEEFDACESGNHSLAPATTSFISTMKNLAP